MQWIIIEDIVILDDDTILLINKVKFLQRVRWTMI